MPWQDALDAFVVGALTVMEQLNELVGDLLLINRALNIRQRKHGTRR
jgi:hypothetical protein